MAVFKIDWIEQKPTSTGKPRAMASITGEDGKQITDVTLWGSNWPIATLMPGMEVIGTYEEKQNGQYLNKTLHPAMGDKPKGFGGSGIKAAQERKGEMIKEAQDRKSDSIAYFNSVNSAISMMENVHFEKIDDRKEFIIEWRDWFLAEYESYFGDKGTLETKRLLD